MGILTVTVAAVSLVAQPADDNAVRLTAELRPGGLLPACGFSVAVADTNRLTVVVTDDQGVSQSATRALSTNEVEALAERIAQVGFFSLPDSVGCFMTEGTDRWMHVERGKHAHSVTLGVWPAACGDVGFLSEAGKREANRALRLWKLLEVWAAPYLGSGCRHGVPPNKRIWTPPSIGK